MLGTRVLMSNELKRLLLLFFRGERQIILSFGQFVYWSTEAQNHWLLELEGPLKAT